MKNDRLNGSCWLIVVGCWRKAKTRKNASFLTRLASIIALLTLPTPPLFAQWEPDVRLTFDSSGTYTCYSNAWWIASSAETLHVVWRDDRDRNWEIYYKRSSTGGSTWGPDTRLTNDTAFSGVPAVAASGTQVHVLWNDSRNGNYEIYHKRSTDLGTTWEADSRLTYDTLGAGAPSVSCSGSYIHAVWNDLANRNDEISYSHSSNGGVTWDPKINLSHAYRTPVYDPFPSVAASGSAVHVVWFDYRNFPPFAELYYKRSTDGGITWGPDTRLTAATLDVSMLCPYPSLAASGQSVHVVWHSYADRNPEIFYKRSSDGGTVWESDVRLTSNLDAMRYPSLAVSGPKLHLAWVGYRSPSYGLFYKFSSDGGVNWTADTLLSNRLYSPNDPSVAVWGPKVHVVWREALYQQLEIYYKRNPTGNSGIEETGGQGDGGTWKRKYKTLLNPFTTFTMIAGHEKEMFELYDIAGRKVGSYKGDRIGANLPAGVYFLKYQEMLKQVQHDEIVRIVKLR